MKRFFISLFLVFLLFPASASDDERQLEEAERYYREGLDLLSSDSEGAVRLLEKSGALYRSLAERYPNSSIYLCLGNIAFFEKEYPLAVYYYREALSFRDTAGIRSALNAARLRLNEQIEIPLPVRIFESVFFFHYRISPEIRLISLYLVFAAGSLLAARYVFKRGAMRYGRTLLTICAVLFICNFASVAVTVVQKSLYKEGVLLQDTEGRSGDHPVYESAYARPVPAGSEIIVLETRPGWYRVRLRDRSTCWLPRESVSLIGETP